MQSTAHQTTQFTVPTHGSRIVWVAQELALSPHSDMHAHTLVRIPWFVRLIAAWVICQSSLPADPWSQFRGPNGQGFASMATPPDVFSLKTGYAVPSPFRRSFKGYDLNRDDALEHRYSPAPNSRGLSPYH